MSHRPAGTRRRARLAALLAALTVVAAVAAAGLFFSGSGEPSRPSPTPDGPDGATPTTPPAVHYQILYRVFFPTEDQIFLASATGPDQREAVAAIRHAEGCGVVASLSPDGRRVALVVLPEGRACRTGRGDDAFAAELQVLELSDRSIRTVATGLDILSPLIWSPDGKTVLVRRNQRAEGGGADVGGVTYHRVAIEDGAESTAITGDGRTLIEPIGYAPDGARLYYAVSRSDRTDVMALDVAAGAAVVAASVSPGAREFRLAPDGSAVLFLVPNERTFQYEAHVYDFGTREDLVPVPEGDQLAAIWRPDAQGVSVAQVFRSGQGFPVVSTAGNQLSAATPKPDGGFDAPVSWSPDGTALAVRHFNETDVTRLRIPTLEIIADGARHPVPERDREVEFIGWVQS